MSKVYKHQVVSMPFEKIDRMYNDLEDKLSRLGKDGYRVVSSETGMIDEKAYIVIILEKEEIRG